ncbi:2-oxo-4-hydroxy-4-carboxy-5-ureidoimidazoline decarboxylase [Streptomyces sp. uw30]|uniref:2-oxo-4-hydroxy-4-carboxy-5-ureidoimidazoline decarboxylase n=1 Tax=Streptomyces sp. uw30 TaxID=1828179 RepID=UPI0011CD3A29|nr:2-oxo-4-hydroxy-4-carboxy-5-ureidoimidazoline decarboxylase [Streptomyces sp. uw30]TXS53054.1 2-oxo-4-hydroxy-4-carboxy-5-ureidoimidazoline decarboxylase [Streptomyces sp. uw30]
MTPTHLPGRVAIPSLPEQTRTPPSPNALEPFNTAPVGEVRQTLLTCLNSPRWADRVADHRPYPDVDSLLAASDEAAYDLSPGDLTQALAEETLPALPEGAYAAAHTALSAAHAAYEAKFGHAFIICLDGLSHAETLDQVLAGIRSRLANDPEEERVVAAEELRRLARGRLMDALGARGTARPATTAPRPASHRTSRPIGRQ